jgi:AcrR family transcriptional regulator
MSHDTAIAHDLERTQNRWFSLLQDQASLPVRERAYKAVVVLLLTSGLKGLADVKTADIAKLSGINESTLFRYMDKKDQLVADAVDWCWNQVNRRVADRHLRCPIVGSSAKDLILLDLRAFLDMFSDAADQLCGTGAMLSYRRAEQLVGGYTPKSQLAFRGRLETLAASLVSGCDPADSDSSLIGTYLTNYLATVWFTWLADEESRGPDGLLGMEMVMYHIESTIDTFASCKFRAVSKGDQGS